MNKNKKRSGFAIFLLSYSLILVLFIAIGLKWVWGLLIDYENGLPEVAASRFVATFSFDKINHYIEPSHITKNEFETEEAFAKGLKERFGRENVTYKRNGKDYTASHPVYYLVAGDVPFAEVSFVQIGENPHGFPVWEVETVKPLEQTVDTREVSIKVPAGAKVYVNQVLATAANTEITQEEIPLAKNLEAYVKTVPVYEIYRIQGLYQEPQIVVEGMEVAPPVVEEDTYFYDYPDAEVLRKEQEELLIWLAEKYGGYLINRVSFGTLSTRLVGNARKCLSDIPAIWAYLYGETYEHEMINFKTSNAKKYSEDCFSCDLEFTLNVRYRVTKSISYDTKLSCIFIRQKGEWMLADFIMG